MAYSIFQRYKQNFSNTLYGQFNVLQFLRISAGIFGKKINPIYLSIGNWNVSCECLYATYLYVFTDPLNKFSQQLHEPYPKAAAI